MTDREVFTKALDLLRTEGWRTKDLGSPGAPKCLAGAIGWAQLGAQTGPYPKGSIRTSTEVQRLWYIATTGTEVQRLWHITTTVVARLFPGRISSFQWDTYTALYGFNDDERTTQEDVELVLKHLIEEAAS